MMSPFFSVSNLFFLVGFSLLLWRSLTRERGALKKESELFPLKKESNHVSWEHIADQLAIIIPARNEEASLPTLLGSLKPLKKFGTTIIVVDDQSTDRTAEISRELGFEVLSTSSKPEGWSGKNWACHQGAHYLNQIHYQGKYILFTDADTSHRPENYPKALAWFSLHQASLMTARPFHRNPSRWETLLGPFYSLVQFITDARQTHPRPERFFSIGQFLLFEKEYYWQSQGHFKCKNLLAEDLALAKECFYQDKTFIVYPLADLYTTRMYSSPQEFFSGWQRNFRLGMKYSSPQTWMETILIIGIAMGGWQWLRYLLMVGYFAWDQKKNGRFSLFGAFLYPLSLSAFILISLSARVSNSLKLSLRWKARRYSTEQ